MSFRKTLLSLAPRRILLSTVPYDSEGKPAIVCYENPNKIKGYEEELGRLAAREDYCKKAAFRFMLDKCIPMIVNGTKIQSACDDEQAALFDRCMYNSKR